MTANPQESDLSLAYDLRRLGGTKASRMNGLICTSPLEHERFNYVLPKLEQCRGDFITFPYTFTNHLFDPFEH